MSDRSTGVILVGILAIAALGLSGYMFAERLFPSSQSQQGSEQGSILVGYWEYLGKSTANPDHDDNSDWLIYLGDHQYNNSNYILVNNQRDRFTLTQAGYYKLTLTTWIDNIADDHIYRLILLKNGIEDNLIYRIYGDPSQPDEFIASSLTFYSDGNDYFEINAKSTLDFGFKPLMDHDMLSIEYFL